MTYGESEDLPRILKRRLAGTMFRPCKIGVRVIKPVGMRDGGKPARDPPVIKAFHKVLPVRVPVGSQADTVRYDDGPWICHGRIRWVGYGGSGTVARATGEKTMIDLTCDCEDARDPFTNGWLNKPLRHGAALNMRRGCVLIVAYRQT